MSMAANIYMLFFIWVCLWYYGFQGWHLRPLSSLQMMCGNVGAAFTQAKLLSSFHTDTVCLNMNHGRIQTLQKPGLSNVNYNQLRLQRTTRGQVVFTILCQIVLYIHQQAQTSCLLVSGKAMSQPKFNVLQNIFQFK